MAMMEFFGKQIAGKLEDLGRKSTLNEEDLKKEIKELRLLLLEADVNYKVSKEFCKELEAEALDQKILKGLNPGEQVVKLVRDKMVELLEGDNELSLTNDIIMMVGLQGSGKTTSTAKIANYLKRKSIKNKPLLVACDVYRPAAIDQLKTLGKQLGIDVYSEDSKDVIAIATNAVKFAKENGNDLVIFDTAGRMHVDTQMMEEIKTLQKKFNPSEVLLVVDGAIGQVAVDIANQFKEYVGITGLVFTKMDSDTRGGAIFSVKKTTGIDIKFLGTSEKMDGLEEFVPDRVIGRILGEGDVLGLIEKAEAMAEEEDMEAMANKMFSGRFDFADYLKQLKMMKKMGGITSLMGMMPGLKKMDTSKIDEKQLVYVQAIIESMTPFERVNPNKLNTSRKQRIANGSGTTLQQVNRTIKDYEKAKKAMKQLKGLDMSKLFSGM